jgi:hypothetical protein
MHDAPFFLLVFGILGCYAGFDAYFAPTLAGKRCSSEVVPVDLCFSIQASKM